VNRRPFRAHPMRFIAHRMYPARVDPAIIKIEQRASCDRIVNRFVIKARFMQHGNIGRPNRNRVVIHLAHKTEERLIRIA